ncbi:MAG: hypothetical protein L0241_31345 [Planctomycetia bacterium]|nr:hypothetical protein [Planctomycetia bacterium]
MAFTDYKCIDDVVKKHKLRFIQAPFVTPVTDAPPFPDYFLAELQFSLQRLPIGRSEIGAGEIVLFPILREVWKTYADDLSLFTHESLEFDDTLTGTPDYFVCRKSEYGQTIPEIPYLLVVEAKLDDFEKAWGQCLAAMLAAQKLNGVPDQPVYGITTNSKAWEFGVLLGNTFTQDLGAVALNTLDSLRQSLHAIFRACRDMALAYHAPTPTIP